MTLVGVRATAPVVGPWPRKASYVIRLAISVAPVASDTGRGVSVGRNL